MQPSTNGGDNPQIQKQQAPPQPQQTQQQAPPPPAQWLPAMSYPAATMVMQHQMMGVGGPPPPPQFAPHYLPYHHVAPVPPQYHQQQMQQPQQQGSAEENRTIWVGDLHYWMDENYLQHCFGHTGEVRHFHCFLVSVSLNMAFLSESSTSCKRVTAVTVQGFVTLNLAAKPGNQLFRFPDVLSEAV